MSKIIDIETTGTTIGAGVWQIGAIALDEKHKIVEMFSVDVKLEQSAIKDPSTMQWLLEQGLMPQFEKAQEEGKHLRTALLELKEFMTDGSMLTGSREDVNVSWGNFDYPLLDFWYDNQKILAPWHYASILDLRAVGKFLTPFKNKFKDLRPDTSSHEALSDAIETAKLYANLNQQMAWHLAQTFDSKEDKQNLSAT